MCSTHNEGKPAVAVGFIKTLKDKTYLKNDTYHHSIGKKPTEGNYSALFEEIKTSPKAPKLKVDKRDSITKNKSFFSKGYFYNWLRQKNFIGTVLKRNR